MLTHFPIVQQDELLGSLLARFIRQQRLADDKVALDWLFGNRRVVPSALLQGHINELLDHIGHIWLVSPKDVIANHTLLPLFAPFIPPKRYSQLINNLITGRTNSSSLRSGINAASLIWPTTYQACPFCLKEQNEKLGYYFARRLFQCAGVEVCPIHHCVLLQTQINLQSEHRHQFVGLPLHIDLLSVAQVANPKLSHLARLIEDLLSYSGKTFSCDQWSRYYNHMAKSKQLMRGNLIDHAMITSKILSYWGKEWLCKQGLDVKGQHNWLLAMFRKHRRPFSYLQHFIVCLALSHDQLSLEDIFYQVARIPNKVKQKTIKPTNQIDIVRYQSLWLKYRNLNPSASLKQLRSTREGVRLYTWLYRNCVEWLNKNKPAAVQNYVNNRVDWNSRDRRFVKQMLRIENGLIDQLAGPRRSRNWYAKQINKISLLQKRLNNLPLCGLFFDKYSESIEEYQTRRLAYVMDHLIDKNDYLRPICEIERDAGLSRKRSRKPAREILRLDIPAWQRIKQVSFEYTADRNRKN
jgi:hypothetical protein